MWGSRGQAVHILELFASDDVPSPLNELQAHFQTASLRDVFTQKPLQESKPIRTVLIRLLDPLLEFRWRTGSDERFVRVTPQEAAMQCEDRLDTLRGQSVLAPLEMAVPRSSDQDFRGREDRRFVETSD